MVKCNNNIDTTFDKNSRKRLADSMRHEVTHMMEKTLDFAQVACNKDNFPQLRSKILRIGNDCMRNLEQEFNGYNIHLNKVNEEIIEFKR